MVPPHGEQVASSRLIWGAGEVGRCKNEKKKVGVGEKNGTPDGSWGEPRNGDGIGVGSETGVTCWLRGGCSGGRGTGCDGGGVMGLSGQRR